MTASISIIPAHSTFHIPHITKLFLAYAASLDFSLSFQGFDEELAALPGAYGPPKGVLLAAIVDSAYAGCVALRPLEETICEMKRLFVYDQFRGLKLGRKLSVAILQAGKEIGYEKMRLDTVPSMHSALALYRSLGFYDISPYRPNPIAGTLYFEIDLTKFDAHRFV